MVQAAAPWARGPTENALMGFAAMSVARHAYDAVAPTGCEKRAICLFSITQ